MKAAASTPFPSGIDWASKPRPWRTIGPKWREECLEIARSMPPRGFSSDLRRQQIAQSLGISSKAVPTEQA